MEHYHMLSRPGRSESECQDEKPLPATSYPPPLAPIRLIPELSPPESFAQVSLSQKRSYRYDQSELPPSRLPPVSYERHSFPDAPTNELAPIQLGGASSAESLPSLSAVTGSQSRFLPQHPVKNPIPSLNPFTAFYAPSHAKAESPLRMEHEDGRSEPCASSQPLYDDHDPGVLAAAEALSVLRTDFHSSPSIRHTSVPPSSLPQDQEATPVEPLLSLLTTTYPSVAVTIANTTSAYATVKNSTVATRYLGNAGEKAVSVGCRMTGIEGGVRWYLKKQSNFSRPQASSNADVNQGSNKRRKTEQRFDEEPPAFLPMTDGPRIVTLSGLDLYSFSSARDRRTSMSTVDTLPAYDDHRSPDYSEKALESGEEAQAGPDSAAWPQRLLIHTSGLGVAMKSESLRSLKYCLHWLRWANERVGHLVTTLKHTLQRYEKPEAQQEGQLMTNKGGENGRGQLAARIARLRNEILHTIKNTIDLVSRYTGGALPENARLLVTSHLKSLPRRYRLASMQQETILAAGDRVCQERDMREGAQRILVLAKEALDMISQVSGVLDGTITSAEEWCERLGKRKNRYSPVTQPLMSVRVDMDVKDVTTEGAPV